MQTFDLITNANRYLIQKYSIKLEYKLNTFSGHSKKTH